MATTPSPSVAKTQKRLQVTNAMRRAIQAHDILLTPAIAERPAAHSDPVDKRGTSIHVHDGNTLEAFRTHKNGVLSTLHAREWSSDTEIAPRLATEPDFRIRSHGA